MKAIILAAGKGTRLLPMTLVKPKPLLSINGKTILENSIEILKSGGVNDIIVVTGYKHELFDSFEKKLGFKKVVSKDFETANSSSSLKLVKDEIIDGTIVMNGDLYIKKSFFEYITPNECQFLSQKINNTIVDEYIIDMDKRIKNVIHNSIRGDYGETGIAYLYGQYLDMIKEELDNLDDDEYWENAIFNIMSNIDFYISQTDGIVLEIDSFKDALINNVLNYDDIAIECSENGKAERLGGLTNHNYKIQFLGEDYVLRIPGKNTESIIDRILEKNISNLIPECVTPKTMFFEDGIKLTKYLHDYREINYDDINDDFLIKFTERLNQLHSIKLSDNNEFLPLKIYDRILDWEECINFTFVTEKEREFILSIAKEIDNDEKVLSLWDTVFGNILYNGEDVKLIDFEYAGFTSEYIDISNFICQGNFNDDTRSLILKYCDNLDDDKVMRTEIYCNYMEAVWGALNKSYEYMRFHMFSLDKKIKYFI